MLEAAGCQGALLVAEDAFQVTCGPLGELSVHLFAAISRSIENTSSTSDSIRGGTRTA